MRTTAHVRLTSLGLLTVLALVLAVSNCTEEKPTQPDNDETNVLVHRMSTGTKHYIYRAGQLDTLLAMPGVPPDLSDGDTICFAVDTLDLNGKSYTIQDKSVCLIGDAPGGRPLLVRESGDGRLFYFWDSGVAVDERDIEVKSLRFKGKNSGGANILMFHNVRTATLVDLDFDIPDENVLIVSDDVTVDNCDFTGRRTPHLTLESRTNSAFDHKVVNSEFTQTEPSGPVRCIFTYYFRSSGTLELNGNTLSAQTSGTKRSLYLKLMNDGPHETVTLQLINNQFNDLRFYIEDYDAYDNLTLDVYYDDNSSTVARCVEDTYDCRCEPCCVSPVWEIHDWTYDGSNYSYDEPPTISGMFVDSYDRSCDATVKWTMSFYEDNEDISSVYVDYGCSSVTEHTSAAYKDGSNWKARLDTSGCLSGCEFVWQVRVVQCEGSGNFTYTGIAQLEDIICGICGSRKTKN